MAERSTTERECGCPPAIIMCVHWDGKLLGLASDDELRSGHTCGGGWRPFTGQGYGIHLTEDKLLTCARTADCPAMVLPYPCTLCLEFENLSEAQAEFARREQQLMEAAHA
ncbi:hypothetical protein LCGC14_2358470 [marine sediment metagenome]|uniref:Uncharacterized protein n=1 Tax=marine sediment metagenome TaxID=412755 RepID=A0A0F9EJS1_9ZZZZ